MRSRMFTAGVAVCLAVAVVPAASVSPALAYPGAGVRQEDPAEPAPAPDDPGSLPPSDDGIPDDPVPLDPPAEGAEDGGATAEDAAAAAAAARLARERARLQSIGLRELAEAQVELVAREAEVAAAQEAEAAAREAARQAAEARETAEAEAQQARRDLGNFARLAYTSGPSELTLVASLLDAESPSDAMRRASVAQRVAEHQDSQFDDAVVVLRAAIVAQAAAEQAVDAAGEAVAEAEEHRRAGADWVAQLRRALAGQGIAAGDGARQIAELCRARPEDPRCSPSPWGEGELTRDAVWLMRTVHELWPQIEVVGGYRSSDPYPDHPMGRAVDVMAPSDGRTDPSVALGDEIATHLMEHAAEYGVMYLIWRQRIWVAGKDQVAPPGEWRMMGDRGDWTSNHMDHIHVSVSTGVSGSNIYDHLYGPAGAVLD